jgi:hypothetical protein
VNLAVGDAPGHVALGRNRVVVGDEEDERTAWVSRSDEEVGLVPRIVGRPVGRHEPEHVLPDRLLVTALRRDVDELERPRGKAVGERGHRGSVPAA